MCLYAKLAEIRDDTVSQTTINEWVASVARQGAISPQYLRLVAHHHRLILKISNACASRITVDDAFQECMLHFVSFCRSYDPVKGRFSAHLYFRARRCIQNANVRQGGAIKDCERTPLKVHSFNEAIHGIVEDGDLYPLDWNEVLDAIPETLRPIAIALYEKGQTRTSLAREMNIARITLREKEHQIFHHARKFILA